ncbi:hypothetical protein, partial [Acidiphilium sp.]|uniref:hypothetical protein n=1 Tax=Acidiphilium sp. TaxID=527 RepID=UPI002590E4B8
MPASSVMAPTVIVPPTKWWRGNPPQRQTQTAGSVISDPAALRRSVARSSGLAAPTRADQPEAEKTGPQQR